MIYDGIVVRINELYLFLLDPELNEILDGINISEHKCYDDLIENQLMVVNVIFKDGTQDIDKVDLEEFIHGDKYGRHDVFLYIKDVLLFTIDDKLEKIIKKGEIDSVAKECIEISKNITKN